MKAILLGKKKEMRVVGSFERKKQKVERGEKKKEKKKEIDKKIRKERGKEKDRGIEGKKEV